jgi:hypothetical protein
MTREKHEFQFPADAIATAAEQEAAYHRNREIYWRKEYTESVKLVRKTASVEVREYDITGGKRADVTVHYGDPAVYNRMGEAFEKADSHRRDAERYETETRIYGTQDGRMYELSADDVHYFRLGGEARPE